MSVPELVLSPEYWDGHSFEDFCRGDTVNYLPSSEEEKARLMQRELDKKERTKFARAILDQSYPNLRPVVILTDGTFDGALYSVETIVRIHREMLYRDKKLEFKKMLESLRQGRIEPHDWDEPRYFNSTYIGVLTDSDLYPEFQRRRIITFLETSRSNYYVRWGYDNSARIHIENVVHQRTTDTWFGANDTESLVRITKIAVLA